VQAQRKVANQLYGNPDAKGFPQKRPLRFGQAQIEAEQKGEYAGEQRNPAIRGESQREPPSSQPACAAADR
jgi:hypothetical protein